MRKFIFIGLGIVLLGFISYFLVMYYSNFSEGFRSGELIKFSHKGYVFKTWEGEISKGVMGGQVFSFSVLDKDKKVIEDLKNFQGKYVKVTYVEKYRTFPWWGDTKYFITDVVLESSPYKIGN